MLTGSTSRGFPRFLRTTLRRSPSVTFANVLTMGVGDGTGVGIGVGDGSTPGSGAGVYKGIGVAIQARAALVWSVSASPPAASNAARIRTETILRLLRGSAATKEYRKIPERLLRRGTLFDGEQAPAHRGRVGEADDQRADSQPLDVRRQTRKVDEQQEHDGDDADQRQHYPRHIGRRHSLA